MARRVAATAVGPRSITGVPRRLPLVTLLRPVAHFLVLSLLLSISHTQLPLYSQNQNSKFLHGLANAGYGLLHEDWLAKTADPFPIFTALVSITYRYLPQAMFYLYHVVLFGIYLYSLLRIVSASLSLPPSRHTYLCYLALLLALHSKPLDELTGSIPHLPAASTFYSGLAGFYILGPVFQPSSFGVLLLLSIALFLHGKPFLAVASSSLSAVFEPAYILPAALLTIAYMLMALREPKGVLVTFLLGIIGFIIVLPLLLYIYVLFVNQPGDISEEGQRIVVHLRSPHHHVMSSWFDKSSVIQITVIVLGIVLARRTKLFPIVSFCFIASTVLALVQVFLDSDKLALVAPWRVSVLLVPISTCIIVAYIFPAVWTRLPKRVATSSRAWIGASVALMTVAVIGGSVSMRRSFDEVREDEATPMMDFVTATKSRGDQILVPQRGEYEFEKFRLYTGAPIFVDQKVHPWRGVDVVEWYTRLRLAQQFYGPGEQIDCRMLRRLVDGYGITYVIDEQRELSSRCDELLEAYQDGKYVVYRVSGG
jgi:hypothetical protein